MSESASTSKLPGLVCTFYSYKGGVGRSMALANVGVLMSTEGHRVLLVDWDLEAPGLEVFFRKAAKLVGDPATTPGVVDLLDSRAKGTPLAWRDCLLRAEFFGQSLDIISSGRRDEEYRRRVQQLDWETLFREHHIGNYINALRQEWRDEYDFILVDSRTGITDIGDICTVILPDVLVLLFITNHQNVEGIKSVMSRAVNARSKLPVDRSKLLGVPVPARDERYHDYDKSIEWQNIFATEFGDLYREWLPKDIDPVDALNHIFLPYVSGWSFGERIPVIESQRERADPTSLGAAYARLAALLMHRLDWSAIEEKATQATLTSTRVELTMLRDAERHRTVEANQLEERMRQEAAERRKLREELQFARAASAKSLRGLRILTTVATLGILLAAGTIGLLYIGSPRRSAEDNLLVRLQSDSADVRATAAKELGSMASNDPSVSRYAPVIADLLNDTDNKVREWAVEALGRMGPSVAKFAPDVTPLLDDKDPNVKQAAAQALMQITPAYAKGLEERL